MDKRHSTALPTRREPDCIYYGQCGGCQFRHMSYQEELKAKRLRVQDALARIGGTLFRWRSSMGRQTPAATAIRCSSRWGRTPLDTMPGAHTGWWIFTTARCNQSQTAPARPLSEAGWRNTKSPPMISGSGQGLVRHLFLRTNQAGETLCCVVANGRSSPTSEN